MRKILLLLLLEWGAVFSKEEKNAQDLQPSHSDKVYYQYVAPVIPFPETTTTHQQEKSYGYNGYVPSNLPLLPPVQIPKIDLHAVIDGNPLLAALLLSASLGLSPRPATANHPELFPINPYIALLLSNYGRYVPYHRTGKGIYGYAASNNYHNNKPFGSYKIYEDAK